MDQGGYGGVDAPGASDADELLAGVLMDPLVECGVNELLSDGDGGTDSKGIT